jgi:2-amino-4-hydroxy-6-hydroxymethyldihydropteridine diphosphokinase
MSVTVYLGLGANLGDRATAIAAAAARLQADGLVRDLALSPLYETEAVADEPQPPYLNAVARARTELSAPALLGGCLAVEAALGRVRPAGLGKAPRLIDIDLLLYGDAVLDLVERGLAVRVPHPAMLQRPFVLIPLADVAEAGLLHPATRQPLTTAAPSPDVRRVSSRS